MSNFLLRPHGKIKEPNPINIVKGDGHYVYDNQEKRLFLGSSSLWNLSFGFDHEIEQAIIEQLNTLPYSTLFGYTHSQALKLAEKLVQITNYRYGKVYFTCTGSEANELAIKCANIYQNYCKENKHSCILSFDKAYHGTTMTTMSASHLEHSEYSKYLELLSGFESIYFPYCYRCKLGLDGTKCDMECFAETESFIRDKKDISALIIEPILGSAGNIVAPKEFFKKLTKVCKENGILIIVDEVATGMGRCGEILVSDILGIDADIIVLSKGLNSGYLPMGAVLLSHTITNAFDIKNVSLPHGSSQDGNPLACAAALATIDKFENNEILTNVKEKGDLLLKLLNERLASYEIVGEIRGLGLMIGIEFVRDKKTKMPLKLLELYKIFAYCVSGGLIVYCFNQGISLFPPLIN